MANIIQINGFSLPGGGSDFPYTGSAIISGSLVITGSTISTLGFTGSLFGTSSWANNAITASFLQNNDPNGFTLNVVKGITLQVTDASVGSINLQAKNITFSGSAGSTTITSYGNILPGGPYTNNTSSFNLGSPTAAWKDIYVSNGSINFISGSVSASIQFDNGNITFPGSNLTIPSGSTVSTASFANTASFLLGSVTSASYANTASFYNGQSTVGANLITQASPSAIRYLRINADNSISQLTLAQLKTDLGVSSAILSTTISQSTNTAADITGIGLSVEANSTYVGTLYIGTGCNNTGGVRFAFTFPTGATLSIGATGYLNTNSSQRMEQNVSLASGTFYPSSGTNFNAVNSQVGYVIIDFTLVTAGTSGTFQPQYASGTNTQVSTIYANTTKIKMEKIA